MVVSMEVGQVGWYDRQAAFFLKRIIKILHKTFQMAQQWRLQPSDVTPGHGWRWGALVTLWAERENTNKRRKLWVFSPISGATTPTPTWPCRSAAPGGSQQCLWPGWAETGEPEAAGSAGAAEGLRSPGPCELTARTWLSWDTVLYGRIMTRWR